MLFGKKKINCKVGEYQHVFDTDAYINGHQKLLPVRSPDEKKYLAENFRVVIPGLRCSLRWGGIFTVDPEEDPDDEDFWDVEESGYLVYEETETDRDRWQSFRADNFDGTVWEIGRKAGMTQREVEALDCRIEFDK